jgi:hypothetical protein
VVGRRLDRRACVTLGEARGTGLGGAPAGLAAERVAREGLHRDGLVVLELVDRDLDDINDEEPREIVQPDAEDVGRVELGNDEAARREEEGVDDDLRDDGGEGTRTGERRRDGDGRRWSGRRWSGRSGGRTCETTAERKSSRAGLEARKKPVVRALKMRKADELEIWRNMHDSL